MTSNCVPKSKLSRVPAAPAPTDTGGQCQHTQPVAVRAAASVLTFSSALCTKHSDKVIVEAALGKAPRRERLAERASKGEPVGVSRRGRARQSTRATYARTRSSLIMCSADCAWVAPSHTHPAQPTTTSAQRTRNEPATPRTMVMIAATLIKMAAMTAALLRRGLAGRAAPAAEVFARATKRAHRNRAAAAPPQVQADVAYLRDEVAARVADRLLVRMAGGGGDPVKASL
jgi:hypothetical protein